MASERALERQSLVLDRQPAVGKAALSPQPISAARALQSRLGNRGVLAMMARDSANAPVVTQSGTVGPAATPLRVSSPNDPAEREATATAAAVMRTAEPAPLSLAPLGAQRSDQSGGGGGAMAPPSVTAGIGAAMSGGAPLAPSVRGFMEPRFGADFGGVRIHTGRQAAQLSQQLGAKAFTVGSHVFFGQGQYQPDHPQGRELIAHELTHTVQQGGSVQRMIQQEGDDSSSIFSSLSADGLVRMAVSAAAPSLTPFLSGGLTNWLEKKASSAFEAVFNALMGPARAVSGIGQELTAIFGPMLATLQVAAGQIAQNDCTPLREAADKIEKTAVKLITPAVEKLQPVVKAIRDFLNAVWEKIGSPIWEWIKQYAAEQWQAVKDLADLVGSAAKWLWDKTASIRAVYAKAWKWLKDKLGIGEGPEGENGVLQWVQAKLGAVWDALKAKFAPFTNQLKTIGLAVGGVLLALSPAGPIMAVGGAVGGAIQGLRWLYANWGKGNIIAMARVYIQKTLIPPLVSAAQRLAAAITGAAQSISGALNNFANSLAGAAATMGGGILSFAVSAVQWLAAQANALAAWATGQLSQATGWLTSALDRLESFLNRVLLFLGRVADVVIDIWGLPILLGEAIWGLIPACIRDPIVDFLGPIILSQIELFQELAKDDGAWQKTKDDIGKLIKLVFHDHDLMGAVRAAFALILRVFNLPPDLLVKVWNKAQAAWDVVSKKPLDFIKNTVRALGKGFKLLWDDKIENLKLGLQGWLLGEIKEKNIVIPTNWGDLRQIFTFVTSVLGLTADHVYELLKKRFNPIAIDKIRNVIGKVAGVVEWVDKAIDTTKSPAENAKGMVDQAKEFGKSILTGIAEWVAGKVAAEVAEMAVAAGAATAGLSEVLDIARRIYKAMVTAVRWANRILNMVNEALDNVIDLAAGNVDKVGGLFMKLMQRAMPVVIGFLADQVGLGGIGQAIRNLIDKLRTEVDKAMLWAIDKLKAGLDWLIGLVRAGIKAITDWWHDRRDFTGADGQGHAIYFEGGENAAHIMVASTPMKIETFLQKDILEDPDVDQEVKTSGKQALDLYRNEILPLTKRTAKDQREAQLPAKLNQLSTLMQKVVGATPGDLPKDFNKDPRAPAYSAMEKITEKNLKAGSEKAIGTTTDMDLVTLYAPKNKAGATSWVRMHMITHQVGGVPTPDNWVPAPSAVNTGTAVRAFENNLEALVRKKVGPTKKSNVVWVRVATDAYHPKYDDPGKTWSYGDNRFPSRVNFTAGLFYPDKAKQWVKNAQPVLTSVATIPPPSDEFTGAVPDVNTAPVGQLATVLEVSDWFASLIVDARSGGKIKDRLELEERMASKRTRDTTKFEDFIAKVKKADIDHRIRFS